MGALHRTDLQSTLAKAFGQWADALTCNDEALALLEQRVAADSSWEPDLTATLLTRAQTLQLLDVTARRSRRRGGRWEFSRPWSRVIQGRGPTWPAHWQFWHRRLSTRRRTRKVDAHTGLAVPRVPRFPEPEILLLDAGHGAAAEWSSPRLLMIDNHQLKITSAHLAEIASQE